jgi:hypothetical protein
LYHDKFFVATSGWRRIMSKRKEQQRPVWLTRVLLYLFIPIRVGNRGVCRALFESIWKRVWLEKEYATKDNIREIVANYELSRRASRDVIMTFCFIPIGTIRLTERGRTRLCVETDFTIEAPWTERDLVVEVTLLTVLRRFRSMFGGLPLLVLTRYSYRMSRKLGASFMVMAADKRLFVLLTKILKLPFVQIGKERIFQGWKEKTVPAAMNMCEASIVAPQRNPVLARLFM